MLADFKSIKLLGSDSEFERNAVEQQTEKGGTSTLIPQHRFPTFLSYCSQA